MKCPKENCDGEWRARGSRMSKRTGFWTRKRVCNKCGFEDTTVEVSRSEFGLEMELMEGIDKLFEKYNFNKEKTAKSDDADKDVA